MSAGQLCIVVVFFIAPVLLLVAVCIMVVFFIALVLLLTAVCIVVVFFIVLVLLLVSVCKQLWADMELCGHEHWGSGRVASAREE